MGNKISSTIRNTTHRQHTTNTSRGFTIVELLIVIVVIAILAAISIVAYTGIQQRANDSNASSTAQQASRMILAYHTTEGRYPASLEEADLASHEAALEYTVDNSTDPASFCLTATSNTSSFYVSNTQHTPTQGGCPGHSVGGVEPVEVTNLILNPGFESGGAGHGGNIGHGQGRNTFVTAAARTGDYGLRRTATTGSGSRSIGWGQFTGSVEPGTYTASFWVRASIDTTVQRYVEGTAQRGEHANHGTVPLSANEWTRLSFTVRVTSAGNLKPGIVANVPQNEYIDYDNFMVTEGGQLHTYADGDSPVWSWNGTPHSSTSTGPAL